MKDNLIRAKVILNTINKRCNNPNHDNYKNYGGKGIKNFLTIEDIILLMKRDNYWSLTYPSIDRKKSELNYTLGNCQFIEFKDNIGKRNTEYTSKPIFQFNLDGNFIKEWRSAKYASEVLGLCRNSIRNCVKGLYKTSGGFVWTEK